MLSEKTIDQKFHDLKFILENRDKQSIKMDAHGGHTVLLIYPPEEETTYLERVRKEFPDACLIDLSRLFTDYIDSIELDNFIESYQEYKTEPHKLFKFGSKDDFYGQILNELEIASKNKKLPILIRAGILFGTGIENINIMDSPTVHELALPLVILYPATIATDEKLKYLNFKLASDYRATVIY